MRFWQPFADLELTGLMRPTVFNIAGRAALRCWLIRALRAEVGRYGREMPVQIVFETHSTSEDNEGGIATGWLDGRLAEKGRKQAGELGRRWRDQSVMRPSPRI